MSATTERRSGSLRSRVAVGAALLVALPVVTSLVAAMFFGDRYAEQWIESLLSRSGAVHDHFQRQRAEQLALISEVFSSDPAFSSYVAEAVATGDGLSIVDLLTERQVALGFDFAILLDVEGHVLARTDRPSAAGRSLAADPLVAAVIEDLRPATGLWPDGERLFQAAVTPIATSVELVGLLVTTLAIDDRLAAEMARVGGTDVAFLGRAADGSASLVASSLGIAQARAVLDELSARPGLLDAAAGEVRAVPRFEVTIDGERLAGRIDPLLDADGRGRGAVVVLTSIDRKLRPFLALRRALFTVGAVAALVAVALSVWYVRRTLRPVQGLARAAEAAAGGDYDQDLGLPGTDELRRMARAFNDLLAGLRERREMGAYVSQIARHLPDPLALDAASAASVDREAPTVRLGAPPGDAVSADGPSIRTGMTLGGRYEILATLGAGGMGVVYKARDHKLGELVALKLLRRDLRSLPDLIDRLKSEITLARKITHPNVLRTYDYGEEDGVSFLSMEYVRGLALHYLLAQTRRPPTAAGLFLAKQVADGLGAAHDVGILHRDIKPANVLLDLHGVAKLTDFGLAIPIHEARGAPGGPEVIAGTPVFMAPELFDRAEPTVAADVYSVGVLLYQVFTGERAFEARSIAELRDLKRAGPTRPAERWPDLAPGIERVILRCIDPDPGRRYASVRELRADLGALGRPGRPA